MGFQVGSVAPHVAVGVAEAAILRANRRWPSVELMQARHLAKGLSTELSGRNNPNSTFSSIAELRRWAETQPRAVQQALDALRAANDAVLARTLGSDPGVATNRAVDLALDSGVERSTIDEIVRTSRFK